jgi:hypothetical protein
VLSRDIVDLCDREAETLNRGRPVETLKGLRTRLSNLFLQFIESPDFNPEAVRFQKVPLTTMNKSSSSTMMMMNGGNNNSRNNNNNNGASTQMVVRGSDKERQLMSVTA